MKKLVSSVLVLCMIAVALAGCGNKSTETTKATEATASTESAVSTEAVSETQAAEGEAATLYAFSAAVSLTTFISANPKTGVIHGQNRFRQYFLTITPASVR